MLIVYAAMAVTVGCAVALFLAARAVRITREGASGPRPAAGAERPRGPIAPLVSRVAALVGPSLSESELEVVWAASTALPGLIGIMLGMGAASIAFSAAGFMAVPLWASTRRRSRMRQFEDGLGQVMPLIASNMRAGGSISAAITPVAEAMDDPIRSEFSRLAADVRSGTPLSDALSAMAERNDSKDLRLFSTAVRISQQRGGSLADITDKVGETVRARTEMRRFIRAKTALNRFEAAFLSSMPVAMLVALILMSPTHAEFFSSPAGWGLLAVCAVMDLTGLAVMRKMGDLETD